MKKNLLSFAAVLLSAASVAAQSVPGLDISTQLWESFTNLRTVRSLKSNAQGVWAATGGGVLFWDQTVQSFKAYKNTDGLSQNDVRVLGFDQRGRVWIGFSNGAIEVFDPSRNTFRTINEFKDNGVAVLDFFAVGDSMYLSTSVGVSLYLVNREEVKETYRNLGGVIQSDTVRSILVDGRDLWAATNSGVAKTSLTLPNLQAPESWTIYSTASGLPSNRVLGFAKFQGRIVAVCPNGLAQFENNTWQSLSGSLAGYTFKQAQRGTANGQEALYIATAGGIYFGTTPGVWQRIGEDLAQISGVTIDARNVVWAGTSNKGLFEYDSAAENWTEREPEGPAANTVTSIEVDDNGYVWCTSGLGDKEVAFMVYDGQRWYNFGPQDSPFIHDDCRDVAILQNGERWIATFGKGITVVKGELGNFQFERLDQTNSGLVGIAGDPRFVPVTEIKQDAAGNVWVCNYSASNGNALLVYSTQGTWRGFSSSFLQISTNLEALEIERSETTDRIWVGTNIEPGGSPGVSVLDYGGTADNPSDDKHAGTLKAEDGLRSVDIRAIAQDRDGEIWIGTAESLYFLFSGVARERICTNIGGTLSCLINENVQTVKVDPANNKWIGTSAGISVLSGLDNITFSDITVGNSALVANSITDIAFNRKNGDVWIATTNGISRLRTSFTEPKSDLSALDGYPNPFVIGAEGARFVINNLAANSAVKIYSIDGRLMRSFAREEVPGAQVVWDGKDDNREYVPSGVYLFVAFIEETGTSAVGKVAVVRR
ncbi:hypothetical protein HUU05_05420 [candidate division KSB1 bacterium]|nr:hypothetical protein [candidate division KSB1 bacterium]